MLNSELLSEKSLLIQYLHQYLLQANLQLPTKDIICSFRDIFFRIQYFCNTFDWSSRRAQVIRRNRPRSAPSCITTCHALIWLERRQRRGAGRQMVSHLHQIRVILEAASSDVSRINLTRRARTRRRPDGLVSFCSAGKGCNEQPTKQVEGKRERISIPFFIFLFSVSIQIWLHVLRFGWPLRIDIIK